MAVFGTVTSSAADEGSNKDGPRRVRMLRHCARRTLWVTDIVALTHDHPPPRYACSAKKQRLA
jgi:hypothetical protein